MRIKISLLSIFISFSLLVYSQNNLLIDTTSSTSSLGFRINTGTLIPHDKPLVPLKKGIIKSVELSFSLTNIDNRTWHSYYNYPEVGVAYMFMDLGYQKVLGYTHCFYPYIIFPLTRKDKPINLSLRVAMGLSYITKHYNSISNPLNFGISTPINLYASLGLNLRYNLSDKISANIGINGSHYSNGSIKKPNYGLNIITGSFGINYNFDQHPRIPKPLTVFEIDKSRWLAILSGGIKETNEPGGSKYGIGSLSIEYSKLHKMLFRYGASFDYMYDGSTLVHFREDSVPYQSRLKASKIGIAIMGEMSLYRLSAFANFGVYLYNYDKQNRIVYQKIGIRYRLTNSISTQIALRTHSTVADYFELGVLISIRKASH